MIDTVQGSSASPAKPMIGVLILSAALALSGCGGRKSTPSPGNVTGRITSTSGMAVYGARVTVDGTSKVANTNYDGRYSISGVTAGEKTLSVVKQGYKSKQKTVTVPSGKTTPCDTSLSPNDNSSSVEGVLSFE